MSALTKYPMCVMNTESADGCYHSRGYVSMDKYTSDDMSPREFIELLIQQDERHSENTNRVLKEALEALGARQEANVTYLVEALREDQKVFHARLDRQDTKLDILGAQFTQTTKAQAASIRNAMLVLAGLWVVTLVVLAGLRGADLKVSAFGVSGTSGEVQPHPIMHENRAQSTEP